MIGLPGGVHQRGADVIASQVGVVGQDFVEVGTVDEQFQDVDDAHPRPANARAPTAFPRFERDALEKVGLRCHLLLLGSAFYSTHLM